MTEKFFYIATLDGDSPHQWTPFSDKNENLSSLSQLVSTWQMNIDRPDNRVIRLGLSLIPRAKLFTNGFDRVYGFLIDGSHFRDKQSDRDIDHDLELAIRNRRRTADLLSFDNMQDAVMLAGVARLVSLDFQRHYLVEQRVELCAI